MQELTELQIDLILMLRYSGFSREDAAMASMFLEKWDLEQEMVDWMMSHPTKEPDEILTQMTVMIRAKKNRD